MAAVLGMDGLEAFEDCLVHLGSLRPKDFRSAAGLLCRMPINSAENATRTWRRIRCQEKEPHKSGHGQYRHRYRDSYFLYSSAKDSKVSKQQRKTQGGVNDEVIHKPPSG